MQVVKLELANFRGVKQALLHFDGHALLVGMNNVGKSTVCEALDLVLGLDRLKRFPPVEEFDFYNSEYLDKSVDPPVPIRIEVEAVLNNLPEELANRCVERLERWHSKEKRLLGEGEIAKADDPYVSECLRIKTICEYEVDGDKFSGKSYFCHGPVKSGGELTEVPRSIRQLFGFVYLRALRTGSRALSLERGSLLDIILERRNVRTGIWENAIEKLRGLDPPIDEGAAALAPILKNIESRLGQYVALASEGRATQLFVSQLSREHLRKTISFFLRTTNNQQPIPFQNSGTGTLNLLVLALLSFIAETRKENVIFAMEEPEIALAPHTQRRVVQYLLANSTQCFVSSHSPYVIEQFEPEQIRVLKKDANAIVTSTNLTVGDTLKEKIYRKHSRKAIAEAILGRGVIVCEGMTERDIIEATAEKMEKAEPDKCYPLDLSGVSVMSIDGEGLLAEFGAFFRSLEIQPYAFYDAKKTRTADEKQELSHSFQVPCETTYRGAEKMLVNEVPIGRLWELLVELRNSGRDDSIPSQKPEPARVKELAEAALKGDKGAGYGRRLIDLCKHDELPVTVTNFLKIVYSDFKKPTPIPPIDEATPGADEPSGSKLATQ
jgi:putative ATP-dependent endonuclease of the OLD family